MTDEPTKKTEKTETTEEAPKEKPQSEQALAMLKQMGYSPEQIAEHLAQEEARPSSKTVCLCGHPKARHFIDTEFSTCKPAKMSCPCAHFIPIAKVEDGRSYLWKTEGPGMDHALVKGIFRALNKGEYLEWIDQNYVCVKCKVSGHKKELTIHPFEGDPESGLRPSIQIEFSRWNFFLCETCKENQ
jgi:hypothetical protein